MSSPDSHEKKNSQVVAGVAGAGFGTSLMVVSSAFDSPFKEVLLYTAPAASVLCGSFWGWLQVAGGNYFKRWLDRAALEDFRKVITVEIGSEHTTTKQKKLILKKLEEAQLLFLDREIERFKAPANKPLDEDLTPLVPNDS